MEASRGTFCSEVTAIKTHRSTTDKKRSSAQAGQGGFRWWVLGRAAVCGFDSSRFGRASDRAALTTRRSAAGHRAEGVM